jgi:hypothetical protein
MAAAKYADMKFVAGGSGQLIGLKEWYFYISWREKQSLY